MTPVALYQYVTHASLFVGSVVVIWMAAFLVLCWLLHYEPRQIDPVPSSRRGLIVVSAIAPVVGVYTLGLTVTGGFDSTMMKHMPLFGCLASLGAITCLALFWVTIVELRRAVRLRQQGLVQQPGFSGDQ